MIEIAENMPETTQRRPPPPQAKDPARSTSGSAITPDSIQVPSDVVRKWQEIVDLLAEIMQVPSALIMRVEPAQLKVLVSSASEGNPCAPGSVDTGPYCAAVLKSRRPLRVADALQNRAWRSNPHVKSGMISYLGVPISWPDGQIFGTICVRDNKKNEYSEAYLKLLLHFRDVLQADLESLARLHGEIEQREAMIRRLVDANIIGIFVWDVEGRILEANDAFLHLIQYNREDLVAGRVRWTELTPPEWRDDTARRMVEVMSAGTVQPREKEYFRKDGSRVPVLFGGAAVGEEPEQAIAFVLDLTERKRAEAGARESERRYREMEMDLAHANRAATMGQLTASIAHEVKQPIAATVTNAQAALRWLACEPPDLEEVRQALAHIVQDGIRAGDVVGGIGDLVKKAPPREDRLEINPAIREVIELTRGETVKNGVSVQTELADGLPLILGDRVQLQQVMLNLIINAVEAIGGASEGPRELLISSGKVGTDDVHVAVRDSGPGVPATDLERLFEPFYTTKPGGLGLGLSICRSIIQTHGGQFWVTPNSPRGAIFQFTLSASASLDHPFGMACAAQSWRRHDLARGPAQTRPAPRITHTKV
jgi:PAS domain S-box-containing protein